MCQCGVRLQLRDGRGRLRRLRRHAIGRRTASSARLTHPAHAAKLHGCRGFRISTAPVARPLRPMRGRFAMDVPVNVPLLDLVAQYRSIKDECSPAMMAVIERQAFIMGAEVAQLEAAVAAALPHQARDRLRQRHRRAAAAAQGAGPPAGRRGHHHRRSPSSPPPGPSTTPAARRCSWTSIRPRSTSRPAAVEAAITPRTRAIIAVHLFGQMAAMEAIMPHRGPARAAGHRGRGPVHRRAPEDRRRLAHGRRARARSGTLRSSPARTWAPTATAA